MLINAINGIKAGSGGSSNVQYPIGAEGEMIGRDARLQSSKDKNLPIAPDLADSPAAVADIEILLAVKGDAGGDAHAFRIRRHGAIGRDLIHRAIESGRDVHLAFAVESDTGGVHHLGEERFHRVAGVNLVDGDRRLLATRGRKCDEDIS